jgi:N-hydroxyarylamine O-acetyltransferase
MDIKRYLERIGHDKPVGPNLDTLRDIHRAHMLTVPFENLDIHLGRPIQLEEQALWRKIILQKRGGFCYELNGLFAWLLKQIGFQVRYLNGRVYNNQGNYGREFDHLALMVQIPGETTPWLADVGFGDSFIEPLKFEFNGEQVQGPHAYRLEEFEGGFNLCRKDFDGNWSRQYFFDLQPRNFPSDYEAACHYHQTSPKSSFTRERITSRATPTGRLTLDPHFLTITINGRRKKLRVKNEDEYRALLKTNFGISVDSHISK